LAQSHENWNLWISDNGSTNETRAILEGFTARRGQDHAIRIEVVSLFRPVSSKNTMNLFS
jgi:glycosyltransferase involved in cell wall biosynthesis